jgi:hypothetical protein
VRAAARGGMGTVLQGVIDEIRDDALLHGTLLVLLSRRYRNTGPSPRNRSRR